MPVVCARWCGEDVHKTTVVACVLRTESASEVRQHVRWREQLGSQVTRTPAAAA